MRNSVSASNAAEHPIVIILVVIFSCFCNKLVLFFF